MVNWNEKRQEKWRAGTLRYADAKVSAATAPLLARIAELEAANEAFGKRQEWWNARMLELEQQLAEARKDAERWNWLNWHIGVAWGEEGFTSLIRIVSEKHRALINTQIDKLMSGELPETPAIRAAIKEQT